MTLRTWLTKAQPAIAICVGNRLALFIFVYLGLVLQHDIDHSLRPFPQNLFLDGWFRWDAGHYFVIAQDGYLPIPDSVQQRPNFWPFYPMVVRVVSWALGSPFIAGLVVSNLALLFACVILHRWVCRRFGQAVATRTVTLLLCCPFSFYFSAMYTESVFLLVVLGAFYFSQRDRWLLASVCAAMAGATRLVGVVVVIPVVISYLQAHRWRLSAIRWDALWLLVGFAGPLSYVLFLQLRFGDGFAFLRSQWVPGWGNDSAWSRLALLLDRVSDWSHLATGSFDAIAAINLGFGAFALLVCLVTFRRLGVAAGVWAVLTMLISMRIWASSGRYAAVVWPMYLGLSLLTERRPYLYQSMVTGLCLLQALLAFWFAHGHWVA
jgi:hypothetical protein